MKIVKTIQLKIVIFTAVRNRCLLHRRVFEMSVGSSSSNVNDKLYSQTSIRAPPLGAD